MAGDCSMLALSGFNPLIRQSNVKRQGSQMIARRRFKYAHQCISEGEVDNNLTCEPTNTSLQLQIGTQPSDVEVFTGHCLHVVCQLVNIKFA